MTSKTRPFRLAGLAMIALILLVGAACGNDSEQRETRVPESEDENLASDDWEEKGEYDDIYQNPGRYVDERVTVAGIVVDLYGDQLFRMNTFETARELDSGLVIVHPGRKDLRVGGRVRVIGTIQPIETFESPAIAEARQSLVEDQFVLVATDLTLLPIVP